MVNILRSHPNKEWWKVVKTINPTTGKFKSFPKFSSKCDKRARDSSHFFLIPEIFVRKAPVLEENKKSKREVSRE